MMVPPTDLSSGIGFTTRLRKEESPLVVILVARLTTLLDPLLDSRKADKHAKRTSSFSMF